MGGGHIWFPEADREVASFFLKFDTDGRRARVTTNQNNANANADAALPSTSGTRDSQEDTETISSIARPGSAPEITTVPKLTARFSVIMTTDSSPAQLFAS